ncbi:unnamed protein product [Medioppia subpectinata]|uniref:Sine oculis-binding protein n=1 Tax=Medioppia subpectinata TaxID=1979941 RepID=A0A7R9KD76_9ACAR|nr:unnamed protein product [Medioppia subpectinata]CAG2101343.1 unnamed protein product [Medioppia subpectinata]
MNNQNIPPGCIVCAWCAKVGMKLFTLRTANGCKAFCSELCFTQCRRASFKKNKICDWCKHVRHTVNYVDFQDGEQQLQFCSNKCLNQYKMNIFCNEAKAHLHLSPTLMKDSTTKATPVSSTKNTSNLITPELWLNNTKNGENDGNSVHSFMDSSDSDLELELDDSQPMNALPLKRRFSELSKESNETPKDDKSLRDKSPKESKRTKHLHKSSGSSRHTPSAKHTRHSNPELLQKSEWPSKESSTDKLSPNYHHSPTYRPNPRPHSPAPPVVPAPVSSIRTSMVANNHNIPQLLSQSVATPNNRSGASLTPMLPNGSPTGHLFPRLPGSIARGDHQIRAPLMPTPGFGARVPPPMPHNMFGAQMEMLLRMQSSFAGLRPPLPPFLPPHPPPNAHSFPGLSHFNGLLPPTGGPLLPPSYQINGPQLPAQMFPNCSLLPPMTIMVPYPVPLPIPIPIPIPLLFPIDKNSKTDNTNQNHDNSKHCNNHNNNQTNISSSNDVTTTSHNSNKGVLAGTIGANVCPISTASKVESVISKLVERKTKAINNTNNNNINENNIIKSKQKSANSMRRTDDNNSSQESEEQMSDSSDDGVGEEVPQNLVLSRDNHRPSAGRPFSPTITNNGYHLQ